MRFLISGATGLVGSALVPFLIQKGFSVSRLTRRPAQGGDVAWNPEAREMPREPLEGFDVVIHLAGESMASGRWTPARKQRIRESRVKGTQVLTEALARLKQPPKVFISASAIGYYGNRGDEVLKEDSSSGSGFLSEVCRAWEAAAAPAMAAGIRVVYLRFGVILSTLGGALPKMMLPFKLGVGGKIGTGEQYMSWVALDEVPLILLHVVNTPTIKGPVNTVAPEAVTNLAYTRTLGRVLSRPTLFPLPAFAARAALGEMADEMLLSSSKVEPRILHKSGYAFRYPALEGALRHVLNK